MSEAKTESTEERRGERTVVLALYEWGKVGPLPATTRSLEADIAGEIARLTSEMRSMAEEISRIKEEISQAPIRVRIIPEIKEVTVPEAKEMIERYYQTHDSAYPSDIADALSIPLETTVTALEELKKEGKVRSV